MLREIYMRDPSDPKFKTNTIEVNSDLELLLNKLRMIMTSKKGEVLGEPDLGLNLEDLLFDFNYDEYEIIQDFNAQVSKYISEQNIYNIELNVTSSSDDIRQVIYLNVRVDGSPLINYEF